MSRSYKKIPTYQKGATSEYWFKSRRYWHKKIRKKILNYVDEENIPDLPKQIGCRWPVGQYRFNHFNPYDAICGWQHNRFSHYFYIEYHPDLFRRKLKYSKLMKNLTKDQIKIIITKKFK